MSNPVASTPTPVFLASTPAVLTYTTVESVVDYVVLTVMSSDIASRIAVSSVIFSSFSGVISHGLVRFIICCHWFSGCGGIHKHSGYRGIVDSIFVIIIIGALVIGFFVFHSCGGILCWGFITINL